MYVDRCTAKGANGKTYTRYLLRESKREGKKTLKTTILNITPWGEKTCEAIHFALKHQKRLKELERVADLHKIGDAIPNRSILLIFPILLIMRKNNSIKIALDPIREKHKNPQSPRDGAGRCGFPVARKHTPNYSRRNKVKKNHWITLTIGMAFVLGIYAVPAVAQQQQQQPAQQPFPTLVAVIDVAQVIRQHPIFVDRQEQLQGQIRQAEAQFQQRQEAIAGRQRALEASPHRPGSPEHQHLLDGIVNEVADFERDARTQQRRFALDNSRIMYETFQDIRAIIERYAVPRGIAQVTDFRQFEVSPTNPQEVAEDMDQRLVWFNPQLNITQVIIAEVHAAHGRPMPQAQQMPGGQPQQIMR